jgi:hypothetical protein
MHHGTNSNAQRWRAVKRFSGVSFSDLATQVPEGANPARIRADQILH